MTTDHRPPAEAEIVKLAEPWCTYPALVPINQYAYFALSSNDISAAEMADIFGIEPDESMVRSSRIAGSSPRPRWHVWKIVCREPGLCVDEQVARIVERLIPYTKAIAELTHRLDTETEGFGSSAVLEIVRY